MPVRTCVGCRKRVEKKNLVRIVMTPDGAAVDTAGARPGRGAYLCPEETCLSGALEKGGLARALRQKSITEVIGLTGEKHMKEGS